MGTAALVGQKIDLAVIATLKICKSLFPQAYDMVYELNEVEARDELYPSTLSYLELLNALIAADPDAPDQGRRWVFRLVGPIPVPASRPFTLGHSL